MQTQKLFKNAKLISAWFKLKMLIVLGLMKYGTLFNVVFRVFFFNLNHCMTYYLNLLAFYPKILVEKVLNFICLRRFDIASKFQIIFQILEQEMKLVYDDLWTSIVLIKPKPSRPFWQLRDLIKCFQKHWIAVFGFIDGIKTSDKKVLDDLKSVFSDRRSFSENDRQTAAKRCPCFKPFLRHSRCSKINLSYLRLDYYYLRAVMKP